ncbi:hypothetical protein D3C81_2278330 [compost metagenome]
MQHEYGITAILFHAFDYGVAHGQPIGLGHVGAVQGRRQFTENPIRNLPLGVGGLFGA